MSAIVASKINCKALCLFAALNDFALVPIECGFIDDCALVASALALLLSLPVHRGFVSCALPSVLACW